MRQTELKKAPNRRERAHSTTLGATNLSRLVSGNRFSLRLADFGADLNKIEDRGDPLRTWQTDGISVHWEVYARNKKGIEPQGAARPRASARSHCRCAGSD